MLRILFICLFAVFFITFALLEIPNGISFGIRYWSFHRYPSAPFLPHPIPRLMKAAEASFQEMLARQSKSLEEVVTEYYRRYQRAPPKGFEEWYEFTRQNNVTIVDDYDAMMEELEPFWVLEGKEFRRRVQQVGQLPSIDLVRLKDGKTETLSVTKKFYDSEGNARAKGFRVMIEKFQKKLPNMDFPINAKAEGRVLIPWEHRKYPLMAPMDLSQGVESLLGREFTPDWKGDSNVWESFRRTCPPSSQARRLFGSVRGHSTPGSIYAQRPFAYIPSSPSAGLGEEDNRTDTEDNGFAKGPDDAFDFCSQPWARYMQGHFFSDWRTIPLLYPVFSPSRAPGFSDILIPSHYYYSSTMKYTYGWDPEKMIIKDVDDYEVAWENKTDRIFWRGATTGGGSSPSGFLKSYQRHRFLEMTASTANVTKSVVFPHPATEELIAVEVPLCELNAEFMDIAFTKAVGCEAFPGGCAVMKKYYNFSEPVPMGDMYKHKYLVDIDGMGYSARSMALLASESALMKATVYREFFTDWIRPWLHYIPLSQSYEEIYNIHAFFSGPSEAMLNAANIALAFVNSRSYKGDKLLRKIASEGRKWKYSIGRKVDMEAYVYRLCLEYARLWSDDREAMSYSV